MLRNILVLATTLTLAAVAPAMAQTSTDDAYTTMPPPAGYDDITPDDGFDIPGTNHRDSADSPSSANTGASSTGSSGTSGGSTGTGSTGGGGASARR